MAALVEAQVVDRARRDIRLFGLFLLALLVSFPLQLPFRLAGIVFGIGAGYAGLRALVDLSRLRRFGGKPRGVWPISAGLGLVGVLVLILVADAITYPLASDLESCRRGALTRTAQQACDQQAKDRLDQVVDRLRERSGTP